MDFDDEAERIIRDFSQALVSLALGDSTPEDLALVREKLKKAIAEALDAAMEEGMIGAMSLSETGPR